MTLIDHVLSLIQGDSKTIAFAAIAGVVSFIAKAAYDVWSARRRDRLGRVSQQLSLLYGPLYSLNKAGDSAWAAFRSKVRPGKKFFGAHDQDRPTADELLAWRYWMVNVFRPIHDRMFEIITKHQDLFIEDTVPECVQDFCAHVSAYKVIFARWADHDFNDHISVLNYPKKTLSPYLEVAFTTLKSEHTKALGPSKNLMREVADKTRPDKTDK